MSVCSEIAIFSQRVLQWVCCVALLALPAHWTLIADEPDLTSWGSDHVGQDIPDYMTGDECLFCHRNVGATWHQNPHQTTLRRADPGQPEIQALAQCSPGAAEKIDFLMGSQRLVRYLKRSQAYGRLDLLSARYRPAADAQKHSLAGPLVDSDNIDWHGETFAERCVGCHSTAVDSTRRTFASTSLDCYVCHGQVDVQHTSDFTRVLLSKRPQDPLVVNSICCSCHLRGGRSRSAELPYPNTFVPGDNLFRDFQVELSDAAIAQLPAMQQHIYLNARMVGSGQAEPTCIDCHSVHGNHSQQHVELKESGICLTCHQPGTDNSQLIDALQQYDNSTVRNATCDY